MYRFSTKGYLGRLWASWHVNVKVAWCRFSFAPSIQNLFAIKFCKEVNQLIINKPGGYLIKKIFSSLAPHLGAILVALAGKQGKWYEDTNGIF